MSQVTAAKTGIQEPTNNRFTYASCCPSGPDDHVPGPPLVLNGYCTGMDRSLLSREWKRKREKESNALQRFEVIAGGAPGDRPLEAKDFDRLGR